MASVEVDSIEAVDANPVPTTPETPTYPEAPAIADQVATTEGTPEEIETTQAVVELPESEDSGAIKEQEGEVSAEVVGDGVPAGELVPAEETEETDEAEEKKEESPPAGEAEPKPTADELKGPAELEGELDPPKQELKEEEKKADVAERSGSI